ncbi:MAG: hypothetical protein ACR2FZ_07180 [Thermoleophilaceae bacterium]
MELRRALLLFAIVLALAAIVTSVSRPERAQRDESSEPARPPDPSARPGPLGDRPAAIPFSAAEPKARRLQAGRPATVSVKVPRPGEVELEGLGLSAPAEPLTPARFELLERRLGRYEVRFTPAAGGEARTAGTLRIVRPPGSRW